MLNSDINRPPRMLIGERKSVHVEDDIISEFAFDEAGSSTDSNSVIIEDDDMLATNRITTGSSSRKELPHTNAPGELSDI